MITKQKTEKKLSERIQDKWKKLSPGDIKEIGTDMKVLTNKVSSTYKRSKADVGKEVSIFQRSFSK